MKELRFPPTTLRMLTWPTRFIYSLFLVFSLISYLVMALLITSRSGLTSVSIADYYAGDGAMNYGKTYGELLEVTHFHFFSIPLLLFVQGHLFLLSSWAMRPKVVIVLAAFVGAALDLAAPWLIVYVSRDLAFLKNIGRACLLLAFVLFAAVPLRDMWFSARAETRKPAPSDPGPTPR